MRRPPSPRRLLAAAVVALSVVSTGCGTTTYGPAAPPSGRVSSSEASRTPSTAPSPSTHRTDTAKDAPVVLIVLENHEYSSVVGSGDASFINDTLIPEGTLFTDYFAVSHPSLPNYLAMTSGSTQGMQGTDAVSSGQVASDNLFHQLSSAGVGWRAYQETMPAACYAPYSAGSAPGDYALKHDPAMTYADVARSALCRNVVPYTRLDPHHLPPFSFVTPNECNDMHSCPVQVGDGWLRTIVPSLIHAGAIVLVTFDEGSTGVGGGGHVMLVEVGAGVRAGSRDTGRVDHYGLLAGIEEYFGVPKLGAARSARPVALPTERGAG